MRRGDLIRFVTGNRHAPYGHRSGIFTVAYDVWHDNRLSGADHQELRALLDWFNQPLRTPTRRTASRYPRATETAICWIRATALDHVRRLRRLAALIETAGVAVHELRTTRP